MIETLTMQDFYRGISNEVPNIRALQEGEQIIICKNGTKKNNKIFLVLKKSLKSKFKNSPLAKKYLYEPLITDRTRHVAEIEHIRIPGHSRLFWEEMYHEGEFDLWDIDQGPMRYYSNYHVNSYMNIWMFKVYEMPFEILENVDFKRYGQGNLVISNIDTLKKIQNKFSLFKPVISNDEYSNRRQKIIEIAKKHF